MVKKSRQNRKYNKVQTAYIGQGQDQFKFSSVVKNWTLTALSTHHWTFMNWVQSLLKKGRNYRILPSSSSFLQGGTPLSLNWLWTQFVKVQWRVEQQFKFSFFQMNWTWIYHWIEWRTSIQCGTPIHFWLFKWFLRKRLAIVWKTSPWTYLVLDQSATPRLVRNTK